MTHKANHVVLVQVPLFLLVATINQLVRLQMVDDACHIADVAVRRFRSCESAWAAALVAWFCGHSRKNCACRAEDARLAVPWSVYVQSLSALLALAT